jgi:hypothetical protein
MRKKSVQIFFDKSDELAVSKLLLEALPNIKFVDGQRWPSASPPLKSGINECTDSFCYLWDSSVVKELSQIELQQPNNDKRFQGPTSGVVIQVCRCKLRDGVLTKGEVGLGYDESHNALDRSMKAIFACFSKFGGTKLRCVDSHDRVLSSHLGGFLIGPGAKRFQLGGGRLEASAGNFYEVEG